MSGACICIHFNDAGGYRIADLCCPVHGPGGTEPGDGYWDEAEEPSGKVVSDYEYGDLTAFQAWADRQRPERDAHTKTIECVHHYTEYVVMRGYITSEHIIRPEANKYGFFRWEKSFRDLHQAAEYARSRTEHFVVQREVYCETFQ